MRSNDDEITENYPPPGTLFYAVGNTTTHAVSFYSTLFDFFAVTFGTISHNQSHYKKNPTLNFGKYTLISQVVIAELNSVPTPPVMAEEDCCTTQLIDGNGEFNVSGLDNFTRAVKLSELGLPYAVVAIMGPQSNGKSTLLNHLFHTNFREMDAFRGRSQTTKGIWIAGTVGIVPCTVIMDLEGTDGRERGEDDTAFEKQSALFALAVSDIVLINM